MTERVDTRPLRTAAAAQAPLVAVGAFGSGLGPTYLALAPQPLGRLDILVAIALSAAPVVFTQLMALARTVRAGERETTPWRSPRNDRGEVLRTRDGAALDQLLDDRLRQLGYTEPPSSRPARTPRADTPTGTTAFPAVGEARSMVRPGSERQRTAPPGGPPTADPPDLTADYPADWAAEHDAQVALETRHNDARRFGRELADRKARTTRHAYDPARR